MLVESIRSNKDVHILKKGEAQWEEIYSHDTEENITHICAPADGVWTRTAALQISLINAGMGTYPVTT